MSEQNIANAPAAEVQQDVNELRKVRVDKLQALQSEGNDPFVITKFDFNNDSKNIKENFEAYKEYLKDKYYIFFEIGYNQGERIKELAQEKIIHFCL